MEQIFLGLFLVADLWLLYRVFEAYLEVRRLGVAHSETLLRSGVTLPALWFGRVPERAANELLPGRTGMRMWSDKNGKIHVVATRTIGRDVY